MARFERYAHGQFSWVDLMARDPEAAISFYEALFGWSHRTDHDDAGNPYTMYLLGEATVAGMGRMSDEMVQTGMPSIWSSYVTVRDIEESVKRAQELGASVVLPPLAITQAGAMAILADPEGAHISLWQPGQHIGSQLANEPGTFAWNELITRDVEAASAFYEGLFGWKIDAAPGADNGYHTIQLGEGMNGGILPWTAEMGEMPASWTVYFAVESCDDAVAKAQSLGGNLYKGPIDIEAGRFAVVADPTGGVFQVMEMPSPA